MDRPDPDHDAEARPGDSAPPPDAGQTRLNDAGAPPHDIRAYDGDAGSHPKDASDGEGGPDDSQSLPKPWATFCLIAVLTAIHLWKHGVGIWDHGAIQEKRVLFEQLFGVPRAPDEVKFIVDLLFGVKEDALIRAGQTWRIVTPIFLHGNVPHLLSNGLSLLLLGTGMERLYGWRKYLLIFFISGVMGNVSSFLFSPVESLGASGALFGLVGAGIVFPIRYRRLVASRARRAILRQLLFVAGLNLFIGFAYPSMRLDNWAHLGGLAGGGLAAMFLIPDIIDPGPERRLSRIAVSAMLYAAALTVAWAGASEWRWARQIMSVETVTVASGLRDPWWTARVPISYRLVGSLKWVSPRGYYFEIYDIPVNSPVGQELLQYASKAPEKTVLRIDGKPAVEMHYVWPDGNRSGLMTLIGPYGRLLVLDMSFPGTSPGAPAAQEYGRILATLRFPHTQNKPAPVAGAPPHAPPVVEPNGAP
jgi:membrane associated rhomboid family serine protease